MQNQIASFSSTDSKFQFKVENIDNQILQRGEVLIRQSLFSLEEYAYHEKQALAGVGEVVRVGEGITWLKEGDKVFFCTKPQFFASYRVMHHSSVLKVPNFLSLELSLVLFIRGFIAHMLTVRTIIVRDKMKVIVDNIDSPTGSIIGWFAKERGAFVVGIQQNHSTISGCADVILQANDPTLSKDLLQNAPNGYHIYFSGGIQNLNFTTISRHILPIGVIVDSFGSIKDFDGKLLGSNSLFYTRPQLKDYKFMREEMVLTFEDLKFRLQAFQPQIVINTIPLAQIDHAFANFAQSNQAFIIKT